MLTLIPKNKIFQTPTQKHRQQPILATFPDEKNSANVVLEIFWRDNAVEEAAARQALHLWENGIAWV